MLGALTLHRYLIAFRRWELCFCSLKAMLLQTESNAPTLWNDCNWNLTPALSEGEGAQSVKSLRTADETGSQAGKIREICGKKQNNK